VPQIEYNLAMFAYDNIYAMYSNYFGNKILVNEVYKKDLKVLFLFTIILWCEIFDLMLICL